jgi:hypothetical protein
MDEQTLKSLDIHIKSVTITDELIDLVLKLKEYHPSRQMTNRGGWRSDKFIQEELWIKSLREQVEHLCQSPTRRFWVNINGKAHWNEWHTHEFKRYACVFYLQVPKDSGDIVFRKDNIEYPLTPYPGLMLMFPGILEHKVMPSNSEELRISIAANLELPVPIV